LSRIPIRLRLTLPFAVGMALVLAAAGAVIYLRVGGELLSSVDQNLTAQVTEAVSHAQEGRTLLDPDVSEGPAIAQVELADGTTFDSAPSTLPALLDSAALANVLAGHKVRTTTEVGGLRGQWRLLATPVLVDNQTAVLIIGRSLAARQETLHRLAREFLLFAPAVLLLAILGGYGLAAAALRPVEAMRRRAEAVSATSPGRLPVPPARDEIAALAVTLNEMLARLEAAFEHERRFVADASHELRTPLALLRAELELALRRPRSREELEDAVRSAAEETERLTRLAEDLLLIARSDQGALPLRHEVVDLDELLERVRARFAGRAEGLGRELTIERVGGLLLDSDPVRLEQALGNLVDNALTHGLGPVSLAARSHGGVVELHVTDEGAGFPDTFVERAFDRFSRADDARSTQGTGLGLAIVALIARAHGGQAHAENRVRGGADVWLAFPERGSVDGEERSAAPLVAQS
jgi:two-component system OmpR family sensor kinase